MSTNNAPKQTAFLVTAAAMLLGASLPMTSCSKESTSSGPTNDPAGSVGTDLEDPGKAVNPAIGDAPTDNSADRIAAPPDSTLLGESSNQLAVDLYKTQREEKGNLAFSPMSIQLAFGMTYAGADGATAKEMQATLHVPAGQELHLSASQFLSQIARSQGSGGKNKGPELAVVNRLFADGKYKFQADFLATTKESYLAPLETMDYAADPEKARQHINNWIGKQTKDRIVDLLPEGSITGATRLVLANAIYFLGSWDKPFEKNATRDQSFFVSEGKGKKAKSQEIKVPMMVQSESFGYAETDDAQILRMPYQGNAWSMTVVLPKAKDGLSALEENLDSASLASWIAKTRATREIEVHLPRFEIDDATFPLKEALIELGMKKPFSESEADFAKMSEPGETPLYISGAFHKAFVKVDEKGTEAAAATAVVMAEKGMAAPQEVTRFVADHGFLFAIHNQEGHLLFLGRVVDPR